MRPLALFLAASVLAGLARAADPAPEPVAPAAPAAETVIDSGRLEYQSTDTEARFVFTDNVKVTGTNLIVTCERLEVVSRREGPADATIGQLGSIQTILATGNVVITQEGRKATADRAELRPVEGRVVLTGQPMVVDPQGVVTGERITLLQGHRRALVEGSAGRPARVVLPTLPDLGFPAGGQPPPGAAPLPAPDVPAPRP